MLSNHFISETVRSVKIQNSRVISVYLIVIVEEHALIWTWLCRIFFPKIINQIQSTTISCFVFQPSHRRQYNRGHSHRRLSRPSICHRTHRGARPGRHHHPNGPSRQSHPHPDLPAKYHFHPPAAPLLRRQPNGLQGLGLHQCPLLGRRPHWDVAFAGGVPRLAAADAVWSIALTAAHYIEGVDAGVVRDEWSRL